MYTEYITIILLQSSSEMLELGNKFQYHNIFDHLILLMIPQKYHWDD